MSYFTKKTWLARLGQGLNKFIFNGGSKVTLESSPDTISQEGTALSATNFNDLENRIETGFTNAENADGTLQNNINTETTSRQNADSQLNKRVNNLEQVAGDYTEIDYPDDTYGYGEVPSGKADYAEAVSLKGVTRGWNQLIQSRTETITNSGSGTYINGNVISGIANTSHKYLWSFNLAVSGTGIVRTRNPYISGSLSTGKNFVIVDSPNSTDMTYQVYAESGNTCTATITDECLYDLTLLFDSGNEPSTVAEALARIPRLGQYNAYNAGSLVSTVYSGLKSKSRNIWDEEWELGDISSNYGQNISSTTRIRTANYFPVFPSKTYYVKAPNNINIMAYDADKNYLGNSIGTGRFNLSNNTFTVTANTFFLRMEFTTAYGTTYNNDICINLSDSQNGTYTPYWSPTTLSLPSSVTLRSAGSVSDELDVESGVVTRKVGVVTFDGSDDENWDDYVESGTSLISFRVTVADILPQYYVGVSNNYVCLNSASWVSSDYMVFSGHPSSTRLYFRPPNSSTTTVSDFKTWLSSNPVTINYALASPYDETTIGTLEDNFIETEGGGTVAPVQTQTNKIDTAFTMGYLTV